jgi:arabinofuranosyltransferase
VPEIDFINRGLSYLKFTFFNDPWTLIAILIGLITIKYFQKKKPAFFFAAGIILYLVYIVLIGGDFMGGRFFTAPILAAVLIIIQFPFPSGGEWVWVPLLTAGVILASVSVVPPWKSSNPRGGINFAFAQGVIDERMVYFGGTGLMSGVPWEKLPNQEWRYQGIYYKLNDKKIAVSGAVGFLGYYAGPNVHIIDNNALCDPLLARIPFKPATDNWRIGHFERDIPAGYEDTLLGCDNCILNKNINSFYVQLKRIISGKIWDSQRWISIIKMNLGLYNLLLR